MTRCQRIEWFARLLDNWNLDVRRRHHVQAGLRVCTQIRRAAAVTRTVHMQHALHATTTSGTSDHASQHIAAHTLARAVVVLRMRRGACNHVSW
jgi:hypothetical protein